VQFRRVFNEEHQLFSARDKCKSASDGLINDLALVILRTDWLRMRAHSSWRGKRIIISDRRPEAKQGIEGKMDRFRSGRVRVRDRVRVRYN